MTANASFHRVLKSNKSTRIFTTVKHNEVTHWDVY